MITVARFASLSNLVLVSIIVISSLLLSALPFPASALAASASFVRLDSTTAGNWVSNYGVDGYSVSQDSNVKIPSYAQLSFTWKSDWVWANSTSNIAALQKPENTGDRIAGVWYGGSPYFTIDVNLTDGKSHQIALYAVDYDLFGRGETIQVVDPATGAILDSQVLAAGSFTKGVYLIWNVTGRVSFHVIRNAGKNQVISGVFFGGATTAQGNTTAVPVNSFLNSLGTQAFLRQGANQTSVINAIKYCGWRVMRDDGNVSGLINVHNATGAKFDLTVTDQAPTVSKYTTMAEQLNAAGALLAVEGPNEPNNWPVTYNGVKSSTSNALPIAQFQRDLYNAVKADAKLAGIPVFASSVASGAEGSNVGLQCLALNSTCAGAASVTLMPQGTKYADYANMHNYIQWSGSMTKLVDNNSWGAEAPGVPEGAWDSMYAEYSKTWYKLYNGYNAAQLPTVPKVTTETGFLVKPGFGFYVTQAQQGNLYLNLYLSAYKRGWSYTFIYSLQDWGYGMGFYDDNYVPRLSATYMHNFTTILADTVSNTPGTLNYTIPSEPLTVHDLLMQKSNGTFYLAVWDERVSGTDSITVNLATAHASVQVYDPTIGTAAVQTLSNVSSIPLTLKDHPLILAISKS